jgi:trk system potassium uptake protein TrkA
MSSKQYVVIGLGSFGVSIATTLSALGNDVLAIDSSEEKIQEISNSVTHAVQADATDKEALKSLGIRNFDTAIIGMGNDIQSSIMISMLVRELGVRYIIAKAVNELHAKVLYKLGVDRVVFPERDMGVRVAHNLMSSNILDYIEISPDYDLAEIRVASEWKGKTLRELNLRVKHGINIMAIKRGSEVNISPMADDFIETDDILVVIGEKNKLNKISDIDTTN